MPEKKYQTRPFQCWGKAKELRMSHYQEVMTAREKGKLLVSGGTDGITSLPAGLGDYVYLGGEPWGATIATDPKFSLQCLEATEAKGFARDMCGYMRNYWGSMFLNRSPFGGEFPKPNFCLQLHFCDSHGKWYQQVSEYHGVPYFAIDFPMIWKGDKSKERQEAKLKYLTGQILDAIEWMEKLTGRKWDDEKFIEAVKNDFRASYIWSEICVLNKAVPAPMDEKTMFSLYIIGVLERHRKEAVAFYESLLDEMKDRVKNQIAAVATERCRLLHDSQPPWYFLRLWRYLEEYGAVCIGAYYSYNLGGSIEELEDGSFGAAKTPEDLGWPLKTREDGARALAKWYGDKSVTCVQFTLPEYRSVEMLKIIKEWNVNGVVMHLNRGCEGTAFGEREVRLDMINEGIPIMTYEGNMADSRELDEARVLARIDGFMETLGLKKLVG